MSWPESSVERERWNSRASLERSTETLRGRPSGPRTVRRSSPALLWALADRAKSRRAETKWSRNRTLVSGESLCYQFRGVLSVTKGTRRESKTFLQTVYIDLTNDRVRCGRIRARSAAGLVRR